MNVKLINYTQDAESLLLFSKETRLNMSPDNYENIKNLPPEERIEKLKYVFGTISSSWEFVDYTFLITGVTRAFTHQVVRQRVGTSFAQQSQRTVNMSNFEYLTTGSTRSNEKMREIYIGVMKVIQAGYGELIDIGAKAEDARGILPTNINTNILFKINLRALSNMLETRLCVKAQGEFQKVARSMKREVTIIHPWAEPVLNCFCVIYGRCRWYSFEGCPIKKNNPWLNRPDDRKLDNLRKDLEEYYV